MLIDWKDPKAEASKHFSIGELIWLPTLVRLATEEDGLDDHVKGQLLNFATLMDVVREFVGAPIVVHCWYRPPAYNALVKGARYSAHQCLGNWSACDFHVMGFDGIDGCTITRAKILPMLDSWGMRMENNSGGNWIHLDNKTPGAGQPRFFVL